MPYIDGFVAPVPVASKDAYKAHAAKAWEIFERLGMQAMWECWGDDIPDGEVTSFRLAVQAKEDETVVFSFSVWPDKATRDAGWQKMMSDPELMAGMGEMPFDGKRMFWGGFQPLAQFGAMAPA